MIGFLKKFERMIVYSLIVMMVLTVSLTTIELSWIIARKVIILDLEKYDHMTLIGIAALIFAIAIAVYAIKRFLTAGLKLNSERPR